MLNLNFTHTSAKQKQSVVLKQEKCCCLFVCFVCLLDFILFYFGVFLLLLWCLLSSSAYMNMFVYVFSMIAVKIKQ